MDSLLELRDKHVDIQILSLLVTAVARDVESGKSQVGTLLNKSLDDFLEKVTTRVSNNAELWAICARYWKALGNAERVVFRLR